MSLYGDMLEASIEQEWQEYAVIHQLKLLGKINPLLNKPENEGKPASMDIVTRFIIRCREKKIKRHEFALWVCGKLPEDKDDLKTWCELDQLCLEIDSEAPGIIEKWLEKPEEQLAWTTQPSHDEADEAMCARAVHLSLQPSGEEFHDADLAEAIRLSLACTGASPSTDG